MEKLIWYDTQGNPVEYELKQGVNRIGRDLSNDLALEHESISGVHCEILNYPDETVLRDLNSTNGLQVNGFPVTEVELRSGQTLSIGDVELAFQTGLAAEPKVKVVSESVSIGESEAHCKRCQKTVSISESKERRVGKVMLYFCPTCGSRCETFSPPSEQIKAAPVVEKTFSQYLLDAFVYPFRENGLIILISGTVFFTVLNLLLIPARYAFVFGLVAILFIVVFGTGYLFNYLKDVINTSAQGSAEPPTWPDIGSLGSEIVGPFIQFIGMIFLCAGPGLGWLIFGPEGAKIPIAIGFFALGAFYYPMSLVAVAVFDSLFAMSPLLVLNSISRIFLHYLSVFVLLLFLLSVRYFEKLIGGYIVSSDIDWGIKASLFLVETFVSEFLTLYLFMVMTRALGVMYYVNRKKLGWF